MDPDYDEDDFVPATAEVEIRGGNSLPDFMPDDEEFAPYGDAPLTGRWG